LMKITNSSFDENNIHRPNDNKKERK